MAHVPHLLVPGPWDRPAIVLDDDQRHHLDSVLRRRPGAPVTYTDGSGTVGEGRWSGSAIERGDETSVAPPTPRLTLAVAPPDSRERSRFLIEKLTELEVSHLRWLRTSHGQGRIPRPDKAASWMQAGLEQSRGAWSMLIDDGWVTLSELDTTVVVADPAGGSMTVGEEIVVAIGPEGGWASGEVPVGVRRASLGRRVLRTETAAVAVAAAVRLHR